MAWGEGRRRLLPTDLSAETLRATLDHYSGKHASACRGARRSRAGAIPYRNAAARQANQAADREKIGGTSGERNSCGIKSIIRSATPWFRPLRRRLPVVSLLVLIASGKVKAHLAAVIALVVAIWWRSSCSPCRRACRSARAVLGAVTGFFPIGWIVLNVIFLYRLTVATGRVRYPVAGDWRRDARPAAAAPADRIFVRCVFRGRIRFRYAGRGNRRDPDRPWLLAARGLRPVADRQYRAGRLSARSARRSRALPASPASIPICSAPWSGGNCRSSR